MEKLFSERLFLSFMRNYKLNVRIARFHNILAHKVLGRRQRKSTSSNDEKSSGSEEWRQH